MKAVDEGSLGPKVLLNRGASGKIYELPKFSVAGVPGPLVFKEFRPSIKRVATASLQPIIDLRNNLDTTTRQELDLRCVWPLAVVEGGDRWAKGLILKKLPEVCFTTFTWRGRTVSGSSDLQLLMQSQERARRTGVHFPSAAERRVVLRECAEFMRLLHCMESKDGGFSPVDEGSRMGVVYGDLNPRNVHVALGSAAHADHPVWWVDCDAVRTSSTAGAQRQGNFMAWFPPREEQGSLTKQTDRFKFGLLTQRVLVPGEGVTQRPDIKGIEREVESAWQGMGLDGQRGRVLLSRSLCPTKRRNERPLFSEWTAFLDGVDYQGPTVAKAPDPVVTPPSTRKPRWARLDSVSTSPRSPKGEPRESPVSRPVRWKKRTAAKDAAVSETSDVPRRAAGWKRGT